MHMTTTIYDFDPLSSENSCGVYCIQAFAARTDTVLSYDFMVFLGVFCFCDVGVCRLDVE